MARPVAWASGDLLPAFRLELFFVEGGHLVGRVARFQLQGAAILDGLVDYRRRAGVDRDVLGEVFRHLHFAGV
jgi:hypothetical protein